MQDHRDDDARDALTDAEPRHERRSAALGAELAPGAVRRERLLPVDPDDAWTLLGDAEGLETWLADEVDLIVAPGEHGTLRDRDGEPRPVIVEDVEPGRRLSLRWWNEDGEPALVDLTLDDHPAGTRFTVTELPLRVVAVPDAVPASWGLGPATDLTGGGTPQMLALACR